MRPLLAAITLSSLAAGLGVAPVASSAIDPVASPQASMAAVPPMLQWQVVSRRPHDPTAWTQGLQFDADGHLFESTGQEGRSTVREVDATSGVVLRSEALPDDVFGEGLALVGDRLIQLTWQDGLAMTWDVASFAPLSTTSYDGEGWGLCFDGERLVMSDGSDRLTFRDSDTFEVLGEVAVTLAGQPQAELNELECVGGDVWANVWQSDRIVRIDPADGEVSGVLDLVGILEAEPGPGEPAPDVLNGIAWDAAAGTFLVTGKLWPELIEIRVSHAQAGSGSAPA